jgi:hypothetical protein
MSDRNGARRRLELLASPHKWQLGGGRRVLWAPAFPQHLDHPGFWDPGTYLEVPLPTLLTWTLIEGAAAVTLHVQDRRWRPDALRTRFAGPGLQVDERKTVTADDAFSSNLTLLNTRSTSRTLDVVTWGLVQATDTGAITFGPVQADRREIRGIYRWQDEQREAAHELTLAWTLRAGPRSVTCTSFAVQNAERSPDLPDWRFTPFFELFDKTLPNTCFWRGAIEHRSHARPLRKWVYVALHRRIRLRPRSSSTLTAACQVVSRTTPARAKATLPDWETHFTRAPRLRCDDPYIEKYLDYRWYGLRLNAVDYGRPPLRHPCVFEGVNPGWFRHAISYSAPVLARDARWLHDPALARGCVLNFLESQEPDGFIPGALLTRKAERAWHGGLMYHADWGGAVRAIHEIHPDRDFLKACHRPLARYAEWFDRVRDADNTGLYDVCDQAETGQEYMSRYLFVDARADEWGPIRLKGVDATVYVHELQRSLAWLAAALGKTEESRAWHQRAERTVTGVREKMWDERFQKFCDVNPHDGQRSPVKVLTDFYPFLTRIATSRHLVAIRRHLLDPRSFWTQWPAPSTALDEPLADAYGRWKGKRMICPWNGRTWLMTNSHIADVLAGAALRLDASLEPYAVAFLTRTIQMLYVDRDLQRPTSCEYYNPLTGQPPYFRGVDDYMHSNINDLIIRWVAGLRPQANGTIVVQPLQFGLERFELDDCVVAGKPVSVKWNGGSLSARVGDCRKRTRGWGSLRFD